MSSKKLAPKTVLADAMVALACGTILALGLASLSQAGIITMGAAIFELGAAFAIGTFLFLVAKIPAGLKAVFISMLGCGLLALGYYEDKNFVPPLTRGDVKEAAAEGYREAAIPLSTVPYQPLQLYFMPTLTPEVVQEQISQEQCEGNNAAPVVRIGKDAKINGFVMSNNTSNRPGSFVDIESHDAKGIKVLNSHFVKTPGCP